jgi:hypothetical protein
VDDWISLKHVSPQLEQLLLSFELALVQADVRRELILISLYDHVVSLLGPFFDWHVLET